MADRTAERMAKQLASKKSESVRVVVRVRPLSSKEKQDGREMVVKVDKKAGMILVKEPGSSDPPKQFTFDNVYQPGCAQKEIYDETAAPIVDAAMEGYNGTIFAYGQTGAGKTHTMEGYPDPPELRGLIPNTFRHIFQNISMNKAPEKQHLVRASYLEIYNESIRDLLAKDPKNSLELKENADSGVYVKDLTSFVVKSVSEIDHVMQSGKKNRSVGSTLMNQTSSRSHSIFTITLETSEMGEDGEAHIRVGKLNMVDLAGSERQSKTGATGDRLKEAVNINLSLSALGNVISALVDARSSHVPYRDSKLTRLLQDSLGGNTKTCMCANCGPADYNYDETLSTLRYANRAKNIKNKPRINEDPKDAMLREFQEEIMRLKKQLAGQQGGGGGGYDEGKRGDDMGGGGGGSRGVSEERLGEIQREIEAKAAKDRAEIEEKARSEVERLKLVQEAAEREKKAMAEAIDKEREEARKQEQARKLLKKKLAAMENKLLIGGELMDKAAKQEYELRQAQIELEERRREEQIMARELAEREEATMMVEEQFASLQDEVDVKTKKLKKLWNKFQGAKREISDMSEEFGREREDMLDTIRDLTRQLKLKDLILDNFVPPDEVDQLHHRANWNEKEETWQIARLDLAGNNVRARRPISAAGARRPESQFARNRQKYDPNPRYRADNITNFDLDMPERTTQDYEGPAMSQRVQAALNAALVGEEDEVTFDPPENLPDASNFNPYLNYGGDEDGGDRDREKKPARREYSDEGSTRTKAGKQRSRRPRTADRRKRRDRDHDRDEGKGRDEIDTLLERENDEREMESQYPSARGMVGR